MIRPFEVLLTKANSKRSKKSKALFNQIHAIDKQRLIKKQGIVDVQTMVKADTALKISLSLT